MNRRNFIQSIGQATIAIGLASMAGYLVFRDKTEEPCNFNFVCRDCKKLDNCQLPESKAVKQNKQQKP